MATEEEIKARMKMVDLSRDERRKIADATAYQWNICVGCGKSEKEYFIETGFDMLIWHPVPGPMCEYCYGDYDDE